MLVATLAIAAALAGATGAPGAEFEPQACASAAALRSLREQLLSDRAIDSHSAPAPNSRHNAVVSFQKIKVDGFDSQIRKLSCSARVTIGVTINRADFLLRYDIQPTVSGAEIAYTIQGEPPPISQLFPNDLKDEGGSMDNALGPEPTAETYFVGEPGGHSFGRRGLHQPRTAAVYEFDGVRAILQEEVSHQQLIYRRTRGSPREDTLLDADPVGGPLRIVMQGGGFLAVKDNFGNSVCPETFHLIDLTLQRPTVSPTIVGCFQTLSFGLRDGRAIEMKTDLATYVFSEGVLHQIPIRDDGARPLP